MIFLAITSAGLDSALRAAKSDDAVWCGADAIAEADYLQAGHPNLSRFVYSIGDPGSVSDAVGTIEEHHPGQTIWVEAVPTGRD